MQSITEIQQFFEDYLKTKKFENKPVELYDPINYIMALGGKRLRPALVLMAHQLFDSKIQQALPVAYAIELFHNFSLVHDDILDEATLRRGKPTVHAIYGLNSGILSGDVMLIYVYKYLTEIADEEKMIELFKVFNKVAIEVCEGQQMDMNFEVRNDVCIDEYLKMIEFKTAALMAGGLEMGAIVAGASEKDAQNLALFGRNIGIAFQLQDDILDTFGDPEKFGKKVGGDIAQNKKTFLVLKALELADTATKNELEAYLGDNEIEEEQKIAKVTAIFRTLNIPKAAAELKEYYRKKAFDFLDAVEVPAARKEMLTTLAERFIQREI